MKKITESKKAFREAVDAIEKNIEYIYDESDEKIKVIIGYPEFQKLLDEMEDLEDVIAYDEAINSDDYEVIPFD
jgi:hypothetical protein